MKKLLSLICLALAMIAVGPTAEAQIGHTFSDGPTGFRPVAGDLFLGTPGRVWFRANAADEGLGYEGSYATLGLKRHMFQDLLDGRWLFETRLHTSFENAAFFANIGVERVFSIDAANADVSVGFWYDYDDDQQGPFGHTMNVVGLSGKIKTPTWDILGNGYFPVGTSDYAQGDPTGVNCFLGHNIVLTPGIDSALKGFDVALRMKPQAMAGINGFIDLGGYGYGSDLVQYFGGGRARLGFQGQRGLILTGEVNYDDRFDVTGVVSVGFIFGANARGTEYSSLGRDLEETVRNDHIVRYQQDLVLALDPDTGAPYTVWHVDNTADPAFEDGRFETRFTDLADAEAASGVGDIIFVHEGDGTSRNYRDGIVLKDDQLFLGDGVEHLIPIQDGLNFVLCNDVDGNRPTITNGGNGFAVTLANNNVVRGFNIDGSEAVGNMAVGIRGNGVHNGIIEDNIISDAILHGVQLNDITGDWNFARNTISGNNFDGILIEDACDPMSTFNFEDNIVSGNGRDGIHMVNYDAAAVTFLRNVTNDNGRHGVNLENFKNTSGDGLELRFVQHEADGNADQGIRIDGGDGNLEFINSRIINNGAGLQITDWTNTDPSHRTLITTSGGGTSLFNGNVGNGIDITLTAGEQRLFITDTSINNNATGLSVRSEGVGTTISTEVVNNDSVSNNRLDGMRFVAIGGSTQTVLIDQPDRPLGQTIANNIGNGISFLAGDDAGGAIGTITATVNRASITGNGGAGIFGSAFQDGNLQLMVQDSDINNNAVGMFLDLNTNGNGTVNRILVEDVNMLNNAGNAIGLTAFGGTFTDLVVRGSIMSGGAASGIAVNVNGNDADPAIDNRTRLFLSANTISNFVGNGVAVTSNGDAHVLAEITGNTIQQNGPGLDPTMPPYFDGINITANGTSRADLLITNNAINQNFGQGLDITSGGTGSTVNAVLLGNDLGLNAVGAGVSDLNVTNLAGNTLCLSMSSNFVTNGLVFANGGAAIDFVIELDGITNGFDETDIGPGFLFVPFGSTCQPAYDASEMAFLADGFPPLD